MLSLTLMTVGMQRMLYVNWMQVRMAGELSFLITLEEEVAAVDEEEVVVVGLVVQI